MKQYKLGLVGEHIKNSYSPFIHNYFANYYNLKISYDLIETSTIQNIDFHKYDGLNVTMPFKKQVVPLLDELQMGTLTTDIVNTIQIKDHKLIGSNTDLFGIEYLLSKVIADYSTIIILGSGAMCELIINLKNDCQIIKVTRNNNKTDELATSSCNKRVNTVTYEQLNTLVNDPDNQLQADNYLIINTTPIGSRIENDQLLISEQIIAQAQAYIDLNYNLNYSKMRKIALINDVQVIGGLMMLIIQAAKSFEIWTNQKIEWSVIAALYSEILYEKAPVILICGMPFSGKTTFINQLNHNKFNIYDLDRELVTNTRIPIATLIEKQGEAAFRKLELKILQTLLLKSANSNKKTIIALGGGTIINNDIFGLLSDQLVCYNECSLPEILKRVNYESRPLIKSLADVEQLYASRVGKYQQRSLLNLNQITNKLEE